MRQAPLVFILEHRTRVDHEAQLRAPLRHAVGAYVVAKPVRQCADGDLRIDRDDVTQLRGQDIRRNGGLLGGGDGHRRRDRGDQEGQTGAGGKNHV